MGCIELEALSGQPHGVHRRVHVADYKTDAVASSDEVRAAHRAQMEAYRSAVAALFGLPSSDVSCALVWLKDPSVAGVGAEVLEV